MEQKFDFQNTVCFLTLLKIYFSILNVFSIEVFDKDKLGKDKSLGKVEIPEHQLGAHEPAWFPLAGVKSGEILLNTELLAPCESPKGYAGDGLNAPLAGDGDDVKDSKGGRRPGSVAGDKKSGQLGDYDGPVLHVDLVRAKDLIKSDIIGKSDPYAVLRYSDQQDKTPVMKNTQNPKWDHSTDFAADPHHNSNLV